ncbi:hypothetical protein CDAR_255191 [Caerostris darwini]|uniref:Uncharacterized protein n=1 Tax=Caerostris darwini TaxID=1538125 RepID=A0AAV4V212_9ARAC|nr:hypothetical protein CDAR_255191 [Caerostris darwini]
MYVKAYLPLMPQSNLGRNSDPAASSTAGKTEKKVSGRSVGQTSIKATSPAPRRITPAHIPRRSTLCLR